MSADQQTLDGDAHPAHLTKRTGSGHAGISESSLGAHEWFCTDCGAHISELVPPAIGARDDAQLGLEVFADE